MHLDSILSGTAPVLKKYFLDAATAKGVPLLMPAAGDAGLAQPTTTSAADMVGLATDAGAYQTAQNSDGSDPAAEVSVCVNPDAVFGAMLSGGAAESTALSKQTVTTESTTGLAVTTGTEWSSPTFDEGTVWGYSGANAGKIRKITSVSSTAGTVTVAFPLDIAVGDVFLRAPLAVISTLSVTLTTAFLQVDASAALSASAAEFKPIDHRLYDEAGDGLTDSVVLMLSDDHVFGNRPS
ncbi:hypothetical protein KAR91_51925 [Candidatus Pacearchaeota archaeon]|nr:hypothetical protein [Candidatus Pacearchaeota archaeon]